MTAARSTGNIQDVDRAVLLPLVSLAVVGALVLGKTLFSLSRLLVFVAREAMAGSGRSSIKAATTRLRKRYHAPGAWALVTGASEGIGREFALQLAQAGFNVCMCARSRDKMEKLAQEIREQQQKLGAAVQTRIVCVDFAGVDQDHAAAGWSDLQQAINDMGANIHVLINNVGANHSFPIPFRLEQQDVVRNIVNVNILATLRVTQLVLAQISTASVSVKKQRRLIMTVGSFAGLLPQPLLSVYSASKTFLLTWSQALGKELAEEAKKDGPLVDVELVNTYFVVSNMSKIRKPTFAVPLPRPYVAAVLRNAGNQAGGASTPYTSSPFLSHAIMNWAVDRIGSSSFWLNSAWKLQSDIRRRALRKMQREQEGSAKTN